MSSFIRSKTISYHLKLFQILGFFPLSIQLQPKSSPFVVSWSLFLISALSVKASLMYHHRDTLLLPSDIIGQIHDIAKLSSGIIAHMTVLMESFLQRKKLEGFFAKLQTLHDKYPVKCRNTGRPRILWEIYVLFIYLAAYEVNLYHAIADDKPLVRLWMTVESSSIPLLFHYCQSILFLEFIRVELIKLNKDLSDIIMFASHTNNPRCPELFEEYLRKRIVKAQKRYQIIYEMVQGLNDFFGTSWAVTTVNTAISCECCIYWIYWEFYNKVVYHALGKANTVILNNSLKNKLVDCALFFNRTNTITNFIPLGAIILPFEGGRMYE